MRGPYTAEPVTLAASMSYGTKIQALSPAAAACAATALPRLPVLGHATVSIPSSSALLIATATGRSLNDREGNDCPSHLTHARLTPIALASAGDSMSGVQPTSSEVRGALESGSISR